MSGRRYGGPSARCARAGEKYRAPRGRAISAAMAWTNRRYFRRLPAGKTWRPKAREGTQRGEVLVWAEAWGACRPFRGVSWRRAARSRFPVLNRTQSPAKRVCVREEEGADGYAAFPARHSRGSGMESASSDEGVESSAGKAYNTRGDRVSPPTGIKAVIANQRARWCGNPSLTGAAGRDRTCRPWSMSHAPARRSV